MELKRILIVASIVVISSISGCASPDLTQTISTTQHISQASKTPLPATVTPTLQPTTTQTPIPSSTPTELPTNTPTITNTPGPRLKSHLGVNALLLLPDQYGANFYLNKDNFEQLGWNVTIAGVKERIQPCGGFAKPHGCRNVTVDVLISEIEDVSNYDVIAIMPSTQFTFIGKPYGDLIESQETLDLLLQANAEGLVIFAPCVGTTVLAEAEVLNGKDITGEMAYKKVYADAGANFLGQPHPPVIDQNIVTAVRGLYYHAQSIEAIATALESSWIKNAAASLPAADSIQTQPITQEGIVWAQAIGGPQADAGRSVIETKDGGFVIAGYTFSFGAGNTDALLTKLDADGNLVWAKSFGGTGWEYAFSVQQTLDGGFILVGYTTSNGAGLKDVLLIKTDPQGNEIWLQTYGGLGIEVGKGVIQTKTGDFIVVGYTESFGSGESDVYLIKTDANGNEIWSQTYGDSGPDRGHAIDLAVDGGYIIAGATGSYSANSDIYLVKVASDGTEQWTRTHSLEKSHLSYNWGNSIKTTPDGGYIIVANSDLEDDLLGIHLMKTDASGEKVWEQAFGEKFYDYGSSISETRDGGYIVSGATKNASTGQNDIYLRKVGQDGNEIWTQFFGTIEGSEWGSSVIETRAGDFVITGHTNSYGAGLYDIWLMRIDSDFNLDQ